MITATVDATRLNKSISRLLSQSKRSAPVVLREQARGVVRYVQAFTPPASRGATGAAAKKQGQSAVRARMRVYGTVNEAFEIVKDRMGEAAAKHFWKLIRSGELSRASDLIRSLTTRGLAPFDGGKLYQRLLDQHKKPRGVSYYVSDPQALKAFTAESLKHVGTLAAGWSPAVRGVGSVPPAWIGRHGEDGTFQLTTQGGVLMLTAKNRVRYTAKRLAHLDAIFQSALHAQASAIERRMDRYAETLLRRSQLGRQ